MSPVARLAWLLIGTLLGLALFLALPERPVPRSGTAVPSTAEPAPDAPGAGGTDALTDDAALTVVPGTIGPAVRAVELGDDLHALAVALLPAAEDGDREAQFGLARILPHCAAALDKHADHAQHDEGGADPALLRPSGADPERYAAVWERRYAACAGFADQPLEAFGDPAHWRQQALAGGHPVLVLRDALGAPPAGSTPLDREALAELVVATLRARRVDAFEMLGALEWAPTDSPDARDAQAGEVAWMLLACRSGFPCGPDADWLLARRAFRAGPLPASDAEDELLFDLPPHERALAQERAAELEAALAAGRWDAMMPAPLRTADE